MTGPEHPDHLTRDRLAAWRDGRLDEDKTVELYQHLVDTGIAWDDRDVAQAAIGLIADGRITLGAEAAESYLRAVLSLGW